MTLNMHTIIDSPCKLPSHLTSPHVFITPSNYWPNENIISCRNRVLRRLLVHTDHAYLYTFMKWQELLVLKNQPDYGDAL